MNEYLITQEFLDYLESVGQPYSWKIGDVVTILPSEDTLVDTVVVWGKHDSMFLNFKELTMLTPQ